jgi:Amt family ammonium transporter
MLRAIYCFGAACCAVGCASAVQAARSGAIIDKADTLLLIVGAALVLFMTLPGLALFYGGLVRAKNFLSVLMHCFGLAAMCSILWFMAGYSLAFRGGNPFIGDLSAIGLAGLAAVRPGLTVPENVFSLYQMTFAIITPALIVGAIPERVRFGWLMLFRRSGLCSSTSRSRTGCGEAGGWRSLVHAISRAASLSIPPLASPRWCSRS